MVYSQINFVEGATRRVLIGGACAEPRDHPAVRVDTVPTQGFPAVAVSDVVLGPVTWDHTKITITGELTAGSFILRVENMFRSLLRLLQVHYLEVDLSGVTTIDETGMLSRQRVIRTAEVCGTGVAVTGASMEIAFQLAAAGIPLRKAEGGTRS